MENSILGAMWFLNAMWFVVGFGSGAMTLVYMATRPRGYLANNGMRWRLTQVHSDGQPPPRWP